MENGARIEIKITDKDNGHVTQIAKDYTFYPDLGWECDFQAAFAEIVNKTMDLLGYPGYKKDYVLLESIDIDEYEDLQYALDERRREKEKKNE